MIVDKCETLDREEIEELLKDLNEEREAFEQYKKETEDKLASDIRVLENDRILFDKRLKILQNAYQQLDIDRKAIEKEKRAYHMNKEYEHNRNVIQYVSIHSFFRGVNSMLALKKRYKDLIKIFHPDNLCGDVDTVQMINHEYDILREKYRNE